TGDSPLFRQIGGFRLQIAPKSRRVGAGASLFKGLARKEMRQVLQSARRHVTSFRYWRSVHMKTFRLLAAVSITALVAVPSAVSAQQKTLYVAGYGGSFEKTIRDEVIPAFEKENGVKVEY
ncbi:hypothetical protein KXW38_002251, partial [Aspergillus fumigatus]